MIRTFGLHHRLVELVAVTLVSRNSSVPTRTTHGLRFEAGSIDVTFFSSIFSIEPANRATPGPSSLFGVNFLGVVVTSPLPFQLVPSYVHCRGCSCGCL
jgi:hypothetical protein